MLRLAADENLDNRLVRGLLRRKSMRDFLSVQEAGLAGAADEVVLAGAAQEGRVLVTHDIKTVPPIAEARLAAGQVMAGVIAIRSTAPLGRVIDDLLLIVEATQPEEWIGKVEYLPL